MQNYSKHRGLTLIEVLVTMLVVSIGLMGLASLQATSIKESLGTSQRSMGIWMADELAARMRANSEGLGSGYTTAGANNGLCNNGPGKMCSDNHQGDASDNCTANEMATYDVWEVVCGPAIDGDIMSGPNDSINITNYNIQCADSDTTDGTPCSPGSNFTITLEWSSKAIQDATANQSGYNEDATQQIELVVRP